ncbi:zinc-binding dehydrogenase [Streptomyces sp. ISL-112]|nr:zinc-binding dehydrogenase [Streptomyces sp. ISL-112]MBT2460698.1 zinc-binding dehydrogenase [Streptomyces sp. ISL-63]
MGGPGAGRRRGTSRRRRRPRPHRRHPRPRGVRAAHLRHRAGGRRRLLRRRAAGRAAVGAAQPQSDAHRLQRTRPLEPAGPGPRAGHQHPRPGRRGAIRPVVGQIFPLDEVAEAHAAVEARTTVGKTLLIP